MCLTKQSFQILIYLNLLILNDKQYYDTVKFIANTISKAWFVRLPTSCSNIYCKVCFDNISHRRKSCICQRSVRGQNAV